MMYILLIAGIAFIIYALFYWRTTNRADDKRGGMTAAYFSESGYTLLGEVTNDAEYEGYKRCMITRYGNNAYMCLFLVGITAGRLENLLEVTRNPLIVVTTDYNEAEYIARKLVNANHHDDIMQGKRTLRFAD